MSIDRIQGADVSEDRLLEVVPQVLLDSHQVGTDLVELPGIGGVMPEYAQIFCKLD